MLKLNPFQDKKGRIKFPLKPTADRIFLFPSPPPEKFQESNIIIPDFLRKSLQQDEGIILALGLGYFNGKGIWHPMSPQLKVGMRVKYDITVPWEEFVTGLDGKKYGTVLCGNADIYGVIKE